MTMEMMRNINHPQEEEVRDLLRILISANMSIYLSLSVYPFPLLLSFFSSLSYLILSYLIVSYLILSSDLILSCGG